MAALENGSIKECLFGVSCYGITYEAPRKNALRVGDFADLCKTPLFGDFNMSKKILASVFLFMYTFYDETLMY